MKFKYYLRGIGIGILVTVFVLMISAKLNPTYMKDADVIKRAKELGMIEKSNNSEKINDLIQSSEENNSEKEDKTKQEPASEKSSNDIDSEKAVDGESKSQEPINNGDNTTAQNGENVQSSPVNEGGGNGSAPSETVTITVNSGMYSDKISQELFAAGLVDDAQTFNKFLISNGYDNNIKAGDNVLTRGMSYEEIAQVLTTKK